jgi:hypothetical protein
MVDEKQYAQSFFWKWAKIISVPILVSIFWGPIDSTLQFISGKAINSTWDRLFCKKSELLLTADNSFGEFIEKYKSDKDQAKEKASSAFRQYEKIYKCSYDNVHAGIRLAQLYCYGVGLDQDRQMARRVLQSLGNSAISELAEFETFCPIQISSPTLKKEGNPPALP